MVTVIVLTLLVSCIVFLVGYVVYGKLRKRIVFLPQEPIVPTTVSVTPTIVKNTIRNSITVVPTSETTVAHKLNTKPHSVYEWYDIDTGETRYVGITSQTIEQRAREHVGEAFRDGGFAAWIVSLYEQGKRPGIREVDKADGKNEALKLEKYYISKRISEGCRLFNAEATRNLIANMMAYIRVEQLSAPKETNDTPSQ